MPTRQDNIQGGGKRMETQILNKDIKFVTDSRGRRIETILPYKLFKELMELKISMEIYKNPDTQRSLRQAENDIKSGNYKKFKSVKDTLKWLREK